MHNSAPQSPSHIFHTVLRQLTQTHIFPQYTVFSLHNTEIFWEPDLHEIQCSTETQYAAPDFNDSFHQMFSWYIRKFPGITLFLKNTT
jgi:hypothetical protein